MRKEWHDRADWHPDRPAFVDGAFPPGSLVMHLGEAAPGEACPASP